MSCRTFQLAHVPDLLLSALQLLAARRHQPRDHRLRTGHRTLFMTGPKIRDWGFITPDGWVHHQQYHQEHAA